MGNTKVYLFLGMVVSLIDAEGPTILGGPAIEVTSDDGPMGSSLD